MSKKAHPDAAYLKQEDIGIVIAKGMAVTYKEQPKNPVDFFAKWLLQQVEVKKTEEAANKKLEELKGMKENEATRQKELAKEKQEKQAEEEKKLAVIENLRTQINHSHDLTDDL